MNLTWTLVVLLCLVVVLGALAATWRFFSLRSHGVSVVIRPLPSPVGRHWRHGVVVYSEQELTLYKLRSLQPWPDFTLSRLKTEIVNRRQVVDQERHVLENYLHVVEVREGDQHFEVAVDRRGDTALVAWLESRPSERRVR